MTTADLGSWRASPSPEPEIEARRARRRAAYIEALRHTQRVQRLRRFIPWSLATIIIGLIGITIIDPFRSSTTGLEIANVSVSKGNRLTIDGAKLSGFRKDGKPYQVVSKQAAQDIATPNLVELHDLDAHIAIGDKGTARLLSPLGLLDSQKEVLDLKQNVTVTTDDGKAAFLKSARIIFKTGTVRSDEPVRMEGKEGVIDADTMEITENGKSIVFAGRVRTLLVADHDDERNPKLRGSTGEAIPPAIAAEPTQKPE